MAARKAKLERGAIRSTTFKLMSQAKLTPQSSAEAKDKVIDKAAKALKMDVGKIRSVVNFGLRERGVYKDVLSTMKTTSRSPARRSIRSKTTAQPSGSTTE